MGAPSVITNPFQKPYQSNPDTDEVARQIRSVQEVQQIPVRQPAFQFSVPPRTYNRGWISRDVPIVPGPTYPRPVQSPDVQYTNKSYSDLIARAAAPPKTVNRPATQLTAPLIQTTI